MSIWARCATPLAEKKGFKSLTRIDSLSRVSTKMPKDAQVSGQFQIRQTLSRLIQSLRSNLTRSSVTLLSFSRSFCARVRMELCTLKFLICSRPLINVLCRRLVFHLSTRILWLILAQRSWYRDWKETSVSLNNAMGAEMEQLTLKANQVRWIRTWSSWREHPMRINSAIESPV